MQAIKRILRYLQGTTDYGSLFPKPLNHKNNLIGYCDSSSSKKQSVVALSTCEVEYISACHAACQGVWLQSLLLEMHLHRNEEFELMIDNKSAISLAKIPVARGRSKHIDIMFHFLRDQASKGKLKLIHCRIDVQVVDILTKPLKIERFKELRGMLNVISLDI
jgi:hypothetical protein